MVWGTWWFCQGSKNVNIDVRCGWESTVCIWCPWARNDWLFGWRSDHKTTFLGGVTRVDLRGCGCVGKLYFIHRVSPSLASRAPCRAQADTAPHGGGCLFGLFRFQRLTSFWKLEEAFSNVGNLGSMDVYIYVHPDRRQRPLEQSRPPIPPAWQQLYLLDRTIHCTLVHNMNQWSVNRQEKLPTTPTAVYRQESKSRQAQHLKLDVQNFTRDFFIIEN